MELNFNSNNQFVIRLALTIHLFLSHTQYLYLFLQVFNELSKVVRPRVHHLEFKSCFL
jgi:hypothetical protein